MPVDEVPEHGTLSIPIAGATSPLQQVANARIISGVPAGDLEELDRGVLVVAVKQVALGCELAPSLLVLASGELGVQRADRTPRFIPRTEFGLLRNVKDAVTFLVHRLFFDRVRCDHLAEPAAALRVDPLLRPHLFPQETGQRDGPDAVEAERSKDFHTFAVDHPASQRREHRPVTHALEGTRVRQRAGRSAGHLGGADEFVEGLRQAGRDHRPLGGEVPVATFGMKTPGQRIVEVPAHHLEESRPEPRPRSMLRRIQVQRTSETRPVVCRDIVECQQARTQTATQPTEQRSMVFAGSGQASASGVDGKRAVQQPPRPHGLSQRRQIPDTRHIVRHGNGTDLIGAEQQTVAVSEVESQRA